MIDGLAADRINHRQKWCGSTLVQEAAPAIDPDDQRRWVAGAGVPELTRRRVELDVRDGGHLDPADPRGEGVEFGEQISRAGAARRERPHPATELPAGRPRSVATPDDVADGHSQPIVGAAEGVEPITPDVQPDRSRETSAPPVRSRVESGARRAPGSPGSGVRS